MSSKSLNKKLGKCIHKYYKTFSCKVSSTSQARTQTFHLNTNYSVSWVGSDVDVVDSSSGSGVVQWSNITKILKN